MFQSYCPDGTTGKRFVLIANGTVMKTNGRLFAILAAKLSQRHNVRLYHRDLPPGGPHKIAYLMRPDFRLIRDFLACDTVIIHSAAGLSLPFLVLARLSGKHIAVFLWDNYALLATGGRLFAAIERAALRLCHQVLLPTADYLAALPPGLTAACSIFPIWPNNRARTGKPRNRTKDKPIRVVFAGQINRLRGLSETMAALARYPEPGILLHVFSGDRLPAAAGTTPFEIIEHGFVPPDDLDAQLPEFDFGLVSLDIQATAPAFPSKILSYLLAGLPVLYHGPELASVTDLLESRGLGVVLRGQEAPDFAAELTRVNRRFPTARAEYLRYCELSWTRLAAVF